ASRIVSKQVRLGKPACLVDAPETVTGASFAACAGLASWALQRPKELAAPGAEDGLEAIPFVPSSAARGLVGIQRWFKETFEPVPLQDCKHKRRTNASALVG
ncbi:MAG: hypothetical protein ACK59B_11980, partial [Alphaproteobacteria bacterium]